MNKRFWLWLLLTTPLVLPPRMATAQFKQRSLADNPLPLPKQSHHDLPGGPDLANAQEMMAQRLRELHQLHKLQDQIQELLKDPQSLKHIKQQFSASELRQLQEKMLKGEGLSQDRYWAQLLQQAASGQKLDQQQIVDFLRRWAERAEHKLPSPSQHFTLNGVPVAPPPSFVPPSGFAAPPPPLPATAGPGPSLFGQLQEESTKWLMEEFGDVGGDVLEAITEMDVRSEGNTPLAELLRSVPQPDLSGMNLSEPAIGLSRYLSNVGDFLHYQGGAWDEVSSIFREAPLPSLPNIGSPSVSLPTSAAAEDDGWAPALLSVLMLAAIILLLYKRGFSSKSPLGAGEGADWRLGPWPVSPRAISTRQDVIRAFEYLALLCLGPAAAACHHRELAERLIEQDSNHPGRRQAAEMLAWLYEQARYAPAGEALSQEQLSDARHALCLLAGVTAL